MAVKVLNSTRDVSFRFLKTKSISVRVFSKIPSICSPGVQPVDQVAQLPEDDHETGVLELHAVLDDVVIVAHRHGGGDPLRSQRVLEDLLRLGDHDVGQQRDLVRLSGEPSRQLGVSPENLAVLQFPAHDRPAHRVCS
jgi:hypothetical protein